MNKLILLFFLLATMSANAQIGLADLPQALKEARAGDTIVVRNGRYQNLELVLSGRGRADKPVVVRAQTPGQVLLTGLSSIHLGGTGIELSGFYFTAGYAPKGAAIEYRAGDEVASNCRITQCAIDGFNPPSRETDNSWILLYGRNNRFDHNSVQGKLNNGVTFAVILDEERNQQNRHSIDHNYFGERPNLGSNGGETIRVGTSGQSFTSSYTQMTDNYFEHCNGEVEVISVKSCDNVVRNNTFFECAGVVALRHGDRNLVEGNAFIGNHKPYTGGIRVINEGHTIRNNYFYALAGDRFFAALAVMNGVPHSLPNRYREVKDVVLQNNVWTDCDNVQLCVGSDNERTVVPQNVTFSGNSFYNKNATAVYKAFDKTDGFHFTNNKAVLKPGAVLQKGFVPGGSMPENPAKRAAKKEDCGAAWYQPPVAHYRIASGKIIPVQPGQNTLALAVESSGDGDRIQLAAGTYNLDRTVAISHYLIIEPSPDYASPLIRYNGTKGRTAMITIGDGGLLEMNGLSFNGDPYEGKAAPVAAVSTSATMRGTYSAWIAACRFYNFGEAGYSAFRAQKTTMADTLSFEGCLFRDGSGDAIYLAAEKDDAGKFSAEYTEVKQCSFYHILGAAIDLYRGGSDESTHGPSLVFDHCVLEDVNNRERGSGIRLLGVQNAIVSNSIFSNSGRGGASIRFDEASWDKLAITNCDVYNSGRIASFRGKVVKGPMYHFKPDYTLPAKYDFHLKYSANPVKSTDGRPLGVSTPYVRFIEK
ncbi:MAG: hypothetical protein INR73_02180 [Williamsia sp.]|nr:hypothetical protein [Williamsia sp.]